MYVGKWHESDLESPKSITHICICICVCVYNIQIKRFGNNNLESEKDRPTSKLVSGQPTFRRLRWMKMFKQEKEVEAPKIVYEKSGKEAPDRVQPPMKVSLLCYFKPLLSDYPFHEHPDYLGFITDYLCFCPAMFHVWLPLFHVQLPVPCLEYLCFMSNCLLHALSTSFFVSRLPVVCLTNSVSYLIISLSCLNTSVSCLNTSASCLSVLSRSTCFMSKYLCFMSDYLCFMRGDGIAQ